MDAARVKQVFRELQELGTSPIEGIQIVSNEQDICDITTTFHGSAVEGTPFEGGRFKIKIQVSADYPQTPPKCYFVTKIFHPNVGKAGEICVNTLKKDWSRSLGLRHILLTIKCLLIVPNAESALNEDAGRLLLEAYDEYATRAKMFTEIHAKCSNSTPSASPMKKTQENVDNNNSSSSSLKRSLPNAASTDKKKVDAKKRSLKRL